MAKKEASKVNPRPNIISAGDPKKIAQRDKVIEVLQKARGMELYAIYQYMNQHYNLDDADYGTLAGNQKRIAIDEMSHAEDFGERIKTLGGEPGVVMQGTVVKGQDVHEVFDFDAMVEQDTIYHYNEFLKICRENGDSVSATLFEKIIEDEQEHLTYFENQAKHLKILGDRFLANIAGTDGSTGGVTKGFAITGED